MVLINATTSIGIVLGRATETTTGSMFITLLILVIFLITIAIMFSIPLEFTVIVILPLLLGYMAYYGEFIAIGMVFLIYLAFIFTQKFFIK